MATAVRYCEQVATTRTAPRRGRPPLTWLSVEQIAALPPGTAVCLELVRHSPRILGRLAGRVAGELTVEVGGGREQVLQLTELRRGRVVGGVYEPGDAVLRVDTPSALWRGGVVRSEGRQVLVEQMDSSFAWVDEAQLERPEDRAIAAPALPRGPVPVSRSA